MNYFKDLTDLDEIKKQYRKLAKQYHPDLNKNADEDIMKEIISQYNDLLKGKNIDDIDDFYNVPLDTTIDIFKAMYVKHNNEDAIYETFLITIKEQIMTKREEIKEIQRISNLSYYNILLLWMEAKTKVI